MNKKRKWKRTLEPYIFLAPLLLIILVFLIVPIAKAAVMSFQYYYIAKPSPDGNYFVGLKNYRAVLTDDYFYNSVKVTAFYIVTTVLGRYVIGFITALLLNSLGGDLQGRLSSFHGRFRKLWHVWCGF